MQLDFTQLPKAEAYRWLASTVTPRPIAWVSTLSKEGQGNLAPFSFFQVISDSPPTLLVNVSTRDDGSLKDTLRNVRETGELVIQLVSAEQAAAMNASAAVLPHGVSEFAHCNIPSQPGVRVNVPRVAGVAVTLERYPGLWHVFQAHAGLLRSADLALARVAAFIDQLRRSTDA